ncbi:hypothetical protein HYE54_06585 [Aggregatibacter actinomycetemcomitans]|uniref:PIN domain-containing protein n=1 Tax=Aggregatibacter actinomycetemcomitans TaxID=714 RepID=UPI00197BED6E|nr:PIN domain-containing protein [Aggregatibacter actinomycetemcomitans]MBN6068427.1 hypothetical protein [Aggregatibacter actinomycetemcomitans]MBN6085055.1 hypothetical protein [Aggregatibacter actinomycetemcomitans]
MDKLLAQNTFHYPIFRVDTTYRYRKTSTPTVFAELLMSLANGDFSQLQNNSLGQIANVLKLDFAFVRYTLGELIDTGMITQIDLPEREDDLDKLPLSDLMLTDNGRKFYLEKKIPGRRRTEYVEFWFNPLLNQYDKKQTSRDNDKKGFELSEGLFPVSEARLQELSGQESVKQEWFDAETELEHDGISVRYYNSSTQAVSVKLTLDDNRYLNIECNDKLFAQWLNSREPKIIKEHLLEPMIAEAKKVIKSDIVLDCPESGLLSLVLADRESDTRQIGNAVEIKFNDEQKFDDKTPLIIFAATTESELNGKHLTVSAKLNDSDGLVRVFFRFSDNALFVEEIGYLDCYFDHQPYPLPVKILFEEQKNWLADLPALTKPNTAVLAFMANFIPPETILEKLPEMPIVQAADFADLVKKTWDKSFKPDGWADKIAPLDNKDELEQFADFFPKTALGLARLSSETQKQVFDWAVDDEKSAARKIPELSDLLVLHKTLGRLKSDELELKDIKLNTLGKIGQWQENVAKINRTFPTLADSEGIGKLSAQLKQWQSAVFRYFEPMDETRKFAVLDTNFIRHHPEQLTAIQAERTVILPQTVLDELDNQKEKIKKDLNSAEQALAEKAKQYEAIVSDEINTQIEDCDAQLGRLKEELDDVKLQITRLADKEQVNG